jgi:hypothetical protein
MPSILPVPPLWLRWPPALRIITISTFWPSSLPAGGLVMLLLICSHLEDPARYPPVDLVDGMDRVHAPDICILETHQVLSHVHHPHIPTPRVEKERF